MGAVEDDGYHRRAHEYLAHVEDMWAAVVPLTAREVFEDFLSQIHSHHVTLRGKVGNASDFE